MKGMGFRLDLHRKRDFVSMCGIDQILVLTTSFFSGISDQIAVNRDRQL